jgi:hypothetical protein
MTPEELKRLLADVLQGSGARSLGPSNSRDEKEAAKALDEFTRQIKRSIEQYKQANKFSSQFLDALSGNTVRTQDLMSDLEHLDRQIKDINETYTDAKDQGEKYIKIEQINEEKKQKVLAASTRNLTGSLLNLGVAGMNAASTLLNGAFDFANGLVENQTGNTLFKNSIITAAKATQEFSVGVTNAGQSIGQTISMLSMLMPGGWVVKAITAGVGLLIQGISIFSEKAIKKSEEVFEKGVNLLDKQLTKTVDGFKDINSVGGILAGGMTQLTKNSVEAGVDLRDFSEGVKGSADSIRHTGLSFDFATQRLAGISGVLRRSELGKQLDALGISTQEQIEMSAEVMARLSMAGDKRVRSDEYVAQQTVKYAEDLRLLQGITGGQAKEAMKKARDEALQGGFLALAARAGGDAGEKIKKMLPFIDAMGETMSATIKEIAQTGTTTNTEGLIMMQNNRELATGVRQIIDHIHDGTQTSDQTNELMSRIVESAAKTQKRMFETGQAMGTTTAAIVGNNATLKGVYKGQNDLIIAGTRVSEKGLKQDEQALKTEEKHLQELDDNVVTFTKNTREMNVAATRDLFPLLQGYTGYIAGMKKPFEEFRQALKEAIDFIYKVSGKKPPANSVVTENNDTTTENPAATDKPKKRDHGLRPAGLRGAAAVNRNPGNLRFANQAHATLGTSGFASFETIDDGLIALANDLYGKLNGSSRLGKLDTIRTLISKYAPPNENDTKAYIDHISKFLKLDPDATIPVTPSMLAKLTTGIIGQENFGDPLKGYNMRDGIQAAVAAALNIDPGKIGEFAKGGIIEPRDGGQVVKVAEAGQREGIFPANKNEPFPFHLDDRQFNKLLSALTGHLDVSKKILGSL